MKNLLRFEEAKLVAALDGMPARRRSLFAAMIATRLAPGFEMYAANAKDSGLEELYSALDHLWTQIGEETASEKSSEKTSEQIGTVLELIPDDDNGSPFFCAQADDAAAALAYALRSLSDPSSREAAWAAKRSYESADNLVIGRPDVEIGGSAEEAILQDPLIQSELSRQLEDLELAASSSLSSLSLKQLRESCLIWGKNFYAQA